MISQFLKGFSNCFKVPELRQKILFTLGILAVYRLGCFIPTPGINGVALNEFFQKMSNANGGGNVVGIMDMFSGGALGKMTVLVPGGHAVYFQLHYHAAFDGGDPFLGEDFQRGPGRL